MQRSMLSNRIGHHLPIVYLVTKVTTQKKPKILVIDTIYEVKRLPIQETNEVLQHHPHHNTLASLIVRVIMKIYKG